MLKNCIRAACGICSFGRPNSINRGCDMLKRIRVPVFFLTVLLAVSPCANADIEGATVLVVPNRYTIVQFAFSMAQMRNVELVAYEEVRKTGEMLMHVWNPVNREWLKTDIKEYSAGTLIRGPVSRIAVIGAENTFPAELVKASSWCKQVEAIESLSIVPLVKAFDAYFTFTPREWKRLAKQYGFQLKDKNEERRRYGRYGKPGEERKRPVPPRAERPGVKILPPEEAEDDTVKPEVLEEKGVPTEIKKPEPAKPEPAKKTKLEKTETKKEQEPLPEDK